MGERWQDRMPLIELGAGCTYVDDGALRMVPLAGRVVAQPWLEASANFGFALRWFLSRTTSNERLKVSCADWSMIVHRHLHGETTEADRWSLALACSRVVLAQ